MKLCFPWPAAACTRWNRRGISYDGQIVHEEFFWFQLLTVDKYTFKADLMHRER